MRGLTILLWRWHENLVPFYGPAILWLVAILFTSTGYFFISGAIMAVAIIATGLAIAGEVHTRKQR